MKALKAIRGLVSKSIRRLLPILVLACSFVFLLCLNSYAGDAEDLIDAARIGDISTVKVLLAKGVDVNAKTNDHGTTVLMVASQQGYIEIVQVLLAKGADVNTKSNNYIGATALMLACNGGYLEVVQALIAKGADVDAKTNNGMTALGFAKK